MDKGTYTYPNGTQYKGEWKDKKRHGYGVWLRPDGMKYEGEWENDKPKGQGTLTYPDGRIKCGEWDNGKFVRENPPAAEQVLQIQDTENESPELKDNESEICPYCGGGTEPGFVKCKHCGSDLTGAQEQAAAELAGIGKLEAAGSAMYSIGCILTLLVTVPIIIFFLVAVVGC